MFKEDMENARNEAVADAAAMERLVRRSDFKRLQKRMEDEIQSALDDLSDEAQPDDTLKTRQAVFNKSRYWIELPYLMIEEGRIALEDQKTVEQSQDDDTAESGKENLYTGTP